VTAQEISMPLIKRYPNRKLYDTGAKKYITLEGIAELIRKGEDIRVIDHNTNEDITELTLTQIIFEYEKKQTGLLPKAVMANLIQAGGDRISALQRTLISPLLSSRQVDEEIENRIKHLVQIGEITDAEGAGLVEKLTHKVGLTIENTVIETTREDEMERILVNRYFPSKRDLERLTNQIDELTARIDELSKSR